MRSFIDTAQNVEHELRRGWTEYISTARRWRRRGLAKTLIVESIRELAGRGMTEVALGVHTENPNGAFDLCAGLGYEGSPRGRRTASLCNHVRRDSEMLANQGGRALEQSDDEAMYGERSPAPV